MLSALLRDLGQSTPPHIARFFADLFCNSAETFSTVSQEGLLQLPQRVTFRKLLDAANAEAVIKETHDGQKIFDRFVDTWNISNLAEEPDLISQDHLWSVLVDVIEVSDESMRLEISERIGAFVSTQVVPAPPSEPPPPPPSAPPAAPPPTAPPGLGAPPGL